MNTAAKAGLALGAVLASGAFGFHLAGHLGHGHEPKAAHDEHAHDHGGPSAPKPAPAPSPENLNAVQTEMRLLTQAMNTVLLSVANNDLQAIPAALHEVHVARDATLEAIKSGVYKLPKNQDRMAEFVQEDDAFHDELVKLLRAARANDVNAATTQVGAIVNGCTGCHAKYRF